MRARSAAGPGLVVALAACEPRAPHAPHELGACEHPKPPTQATCGDARRDPGEVCLVPAQNSERHDYAWRFGQIAVRDFNGDGHLDLLRSGLVFAGDGSGRFAEAASTGVVFGYAGVDGADYSVGDYDGDGIDDVAAAVTFKNCFLPDPNRPPDTRYVSVWFGNPGLDFKGHYTIVGGYEYPIHVTIVPGTPAHGGLLFVVYEGCDVLYCDAKLFGWESPMWPTVPLDPLDVGDYACAAQAVDLDDDGVVDLNPLHDFVLMGRGDGTFARVENFPRPIGRAHFGRDLDCDGVADAIELDSEPGNSGVLNVALWRGEGDGRFAREDDPLLADVNDAVLADINADGDVDVVACTEDALITRTGGSGLSFAPPLALLDEGCDELLAADLDEDGADDLVLFDASEQPAYSTRVRVYLARI